MRRLPDRPRSSRISRPIGADPRRLLTVVVDASALVVALLGRTREHSSLRRRLAADLCHAPHLIDAEVGDVLRRHVLRGDLSLVDAGALRGAGALLIDVRHEMNGELAHAAWALTPNLSFYDGLYVALAAALGAPLLTADHRLSRSPRLGCSVELVEAH